MASAEREASERRATLEAELRAAVAARDEAAQRVADRERDLAAARADVERAKGAASRSAALLERARRAALIAAGLIDEASTSEPATNASPAADAE